MTLLRGDCLALLPTLGNASVDSIVTDPPYELGFMGKSWDNSGIAYNVDLWRECLRVLKPGGHLLAFGGSRTYHRLACAVEDAGFEIRDQIMWIYGSGFPKSLDVSKAIDATQLVGNSHSRSLRSVEQNGNGAEYQLTGKNNGIMGETVTVDRKEFSPSTPDAQRWQGWGTALKPAHEPIVVARKPLSGTVANTVLTYGTGALNIDGCRVDGIPPSVPQPKFSVANGVYGFGSGEGRNGEMSQTSGRWPANVIHDGSDEVVAGFPETAPSRQGKPRGTAKKGLFANSEWNAVGAEHDDEGSAARFFYCAKASKAERNAGLDGLEERAVGVLNMITDAHSVKNGMNTKPSQNFHPTVKPLDLMRYLVRLVTPKGSIVLDPFLGSGTTAVAAILEGFEWIGCEMTEDYWPIIEARVRWANEQGHHARLFT